MEHMFTSVERQCKHMEDFGCLELMRNRLNISTWAYKVYVWAPVYAYNVSEVWNIYRKKDTKGNTRSWSVKIIRKYWTSGNEWLTTACKQGGFAQVFMQVSCITFEGFLCLMTPSSHVGKIKSNHIVDKGCQLTLKVPKSIHGKPAYKDKRLKTSH